MKKIMILFASLLAVLVLSGCAAEYDDDYDDGYYTNYDNDTVTTLFLVDEEGYSYANIPYKCDSMSYWSKTKNNGEFTFVQPDTCTFDFNGLDGVYGDSYDDIVRIVDSVYDGKDNISYNCASFGASSTYSDGSFDYNENDECSFYL